MRVATRAGGQPDRHDEAPGAYEKQVDRLLASPRYGERMAMTWLDGARYADSHGYQADWERYQWGWRDWEESIGGRDWLGDQLLRSLSWNYSGRHIA